MFILQRMNVVRMVKTELEKNDLLKKGFNLVEETEKKIAEEIKTEKKSSKGKANK